ncbi:MAG TPA: tetratricopeptide repeat protein [Anaeromyxobacter sp.]|nr:tetratricopeptide repeat protein [Anaeromyxobacter sp.]
MPDRRVRPRALAALRLVVRLVGLVGVMGLAGAARIAAATPAAPASEPSAAPPAAATWLALSSEHVVLRTDLERGEALRMVRELELMRTLLADALALDLPASAPPVQAVAFAKPSDLVEFTGDRRIAGTAYTLRSGRGQILLMDGRPEDMGVVVAHELAHALLMQVIARQPRWFAEGMAQWASSMGRVLAGGRRLLGTVPDPWMREFLEEGDLSNVRDLLTWDRPDKKEDARRYATSWLLVRTLLAERPEAFAAFRRALQDGEAATAAWNRSFPEWSLASKSGPEDLDGLLAERARDLASPSREVRAAVDPRVEVRPLSSPELHTMRLELPREWKPEALQAELDAALREDPGHVLALTFLARDRTAARLPLARRAIEAHPEDPDAWALLEGTLPAGAREEREAALRKAVALAPDRADLHAQLASLLVAERPEEADGFAKRAVELAPWSPYTRAVQARVLSALGRCDEAADEERRGLGLDTLELTAREQREIARFQERLHRYCGNRTVLRAEALLREADRAEVLGHLEEALALYDQALALDPEHPEAWLERGGLLLALQRPRDAEASIRRQLRSAPRHAHAWSHLGRALIAQGRREEAVAALEKQLELVPDHLAALRRLAETLVTLGRPREALPYIDRIVKERPRDTLLLIDRGRARIAAGRHAPGLADLERAVDAAREEDEGKGQAGVLNNAGYSLAEFGVELDQAERWAEASVAEHGADIRRAAGGAPSSDEIDHAELLSSAWDTLGWVHFQRGRLEEAERHVAAAVSVEASAEGFRHLGQILERRGKRARAIAAYAAALTLEPDRFARKRLAALAGAGKIPQLVARARTDLLRRRVLAAEPAADAALADERVVLVLGPDGKVADVLPGSGRAVPGAEAFRGAPHPVPFLDPGLPRLVLPGRYRCAAGTCALLFGDAPAPAGKLPGAAARQRGT